VWTFVTAGPGTVEVTYDRRIRADKPLLRAFFFLLKPVFSANHRWAMARGEESLRLELARRRAATPEERAAIPPPRGPTSIRPLAYVVGTVLALAALWNRVRRRRSPAEGKSGAADRGQAEG
jgi:hypothetical protein